MSHQGPPFSFGDLERTMVMLAWSTSRSVPIRPMAMARASASPYNPPRRELVYANPQDVSSMTFGMQPWDLGLPHGMHGLEGCGCDPVGGCGCTHPTMHGLGYDWSHVGLPDSVPRLHGLGQNVSLDQIIQ